MASNFHPSDVPYDPAGVDAEPSTQAPNDYFTTRASPDDFGAQVGQAFQHLGAGIHDAAEQFGQIQALHDNAAANAAQNSVVQGLNNTLYAPPKLDAQGNPVAGSGGFYSQRGSDATNAYQPTIQKLNQAYQDARSTLTPRQQILFDSNTRRLFDNEMQGIGRHASSQAEVWQDQQTTALVSTTSDAASLAAVNGKSADFDNYLDQAASASAHLALLKGLGNDFAAKEAAKTIGATVANSAKQLIDLGRPGDAQAIFEKYQDRMDKGSALAVEAALKSHLREVNATSEAQSALGKLGIGPEAEGAPSVSDHGGSQTTDAQSNAVPHTSRPMPKEYADQGMSQADWDKMNAPDQGAQQTPNQPSAQAGGQPPTGNAPAGPTPSHAAPGGSNMDAASVLRHFEGFRSSPYWDVNALRVGYGSDTITKADGTVQKVTSGTQVTRADAERDLERRASISANSASNSVGSQQWAQLPGPAQAALTSLTYNYGHLPESVAAAAKTGDVNKIADAVEALKGANGGVNAQRREQEAAIIRGGGYPGGPAPSVAGQGGPQAPMPPMMPTGQQSNIGSAHQQKADILQDKATVISDIQQKYKDDPEMATAVITKINQGMAAAALSQQASQQKALADQDAALNDYLTPAIKGQDAAPLIQKMADDPRLTAEKKEWLYNALQTKAQGKSLGADFYKFFSLIHSNGADKITDPAQLLPSVNGDNLTLEGYDKIRSEMENIRKGGLDAQANTELRAAAMKRMENALTFGTSDKLGIDTLNGKAIPAFLVAYDKAIAAGESPSVFLAEGPKDIVAPIIKNFSRSPAQEMKDKVAADTAAPGTGFLGSAFGSGLAGTPGTTPPARAGFEVGGMAGAAPASQFDLKNYDITTFEGQKQAAAAINSDFHHGLIKKDEAYRRLNLLRDAASAAKAQPNAAPGAPTVPNGQ